MNREGAFKRFEKIKATYKRKDNELLKQGKLAIRETEYGLWGTTNLNDCWLLFTRIKLERFNRFIDLGCGDGRVVAVASLFTQARGIEGDKELVANGKEAFAELHLDPAMLEEKDYHEENLSPYDCIFMFPDNRYDKRMVEKLQKEFSGYLLVYNDIHAPPGIPRGKTYWIEQLPVVSYPINTEEENLEEG